MGTHGSPSWSQTSYAAKAELDPMIQGLALHGVSHRFWFYAVLGMELRIYTC